MNSLIGLLALFLFGFFIGFVGGTFMFPKPLPQPRDDCSPTGLVRLVPRPRKPYDWSREDL